jgi:hypothetical protein
MTGPYQRQLNLCRYSKDGFRYWRVSTGTTSPTYLLLAFGLSAVSVTTIIQTAPARIAVSRTRDCRLFIDVLGANSMPNALQSE